MKIYQIDTFTHTLFSGNPAAVCPLKNWLADDLMQKIAAENNLAETAFYVQEEDRFVIRWFTPTNEVDLCGHATLAAAYVLLHHEGYEGDTIHFYSPRGGNLMVTYKDSYLTLNFPSDEPTAVPITEELANCFDREPLLAFKGKTDYLLVFETEEDIREVKPHLETISKLDARGLIISAKGNVVDFVSRFFAPQVGIPEDPVTGSAHTTLIPYWASQLHKTEMSAMQLSQRSGFLRCTYLNERVEISGTAKLYLIGEILVE